jgi:hypothetical protein
MRTKLDRKWRLLSMKLLIKTVRGKVQVFDASTQEPLKDIGRIDIYVSSHGKASAVIGFNDIELDIEADKYEKA